MTTCEWSRLISFNGLCWPNRNGEERKIQNENMFPAGLEPTPLHGRKVGDLDRSATLLRYQEEYL